ncbi:MAG: hypothetical protein MSA25_05680 [Clostridiales bacterium]|nr:hypothetical protein [Clostridiales bacterium]
MLQQGAEQACNGEVEAERFCLKYPFFEPKQSRVSIREKPICTLSETKGVTAQVTPFAYFYCLMNTTQTKGMQDREAVGFERAFSAHASRKIAEIHASIPAIFHFT